MIEGQAHFQGLATASVSFTDYLSVTDQMGQRCLFEWSKGSCTSSVDIADYLFIQGRSGEKVLYNLGYSVGLLAVEALSAIKGAESTVVLLQHVAVGESFAVAFNNIYGLDWKSASEILGQVIAKEYGQGFRFTN